MKNIEPARGEQDLLEILDIDLFGVGEILNLEKFVKSLKNIHLFVCICKHGCTNVGNSVCKPV